MAWTPPPPHKKRCSVRTCDIFTFSSKHRSRGLWEGHENDSTASTHNRRQELSLLMVEPEEPPKPNNHGNFEVQSSSVLNFLEGGCGGGYKGARAACGMGGGGAVMY